MRRLLVTVALVLSAASTICAQAQGTASLAADQARAQERMVEVEQRLLALAGQLAADQPGPAARLSDALALSRGRALLLLPRRSATTATIPAVPRKVGATVSLRGELGDGTSGKAATYRVKAGSR